MGGWRLHPGGSAAPQYLTPVNDDHVIFEVPGVLIATDHPKSQFRNILAEKYLNYIGSYLSVPPSNPCYGTVYIWWTSNGDAYLDSLKCEKIIAEFFEIEENLIAESDWAALYTISTQEGLMTDEPQKKRKRSTAVRWPAVKTSTDDDGTYFVCQQSGFLTDTRYYLTQGNKKQGCFATLPLMMTWINTYAPEEKREKLIAQTLKEWEQVAIPPHENSTYDTWRNVPGAEPIDVYLKADRQRKNKKKPKVEKKPAKIHLPAGCYLVKPGGGTVIVPLTDARQVAKLTKSIMQYGEKHNMETHTQKGDAVGVVMNSCYHNGEVDDKTRENQTAECIGGFREGWKYYGPAFLICTKKFSFSPPVGVKVKEVEEEETEPTQPLPED